MIFHSGLRWNKRQFDGSCGKVLSKPIVWRLLNKQKTIIRPVRARLIFLQEQAFLRFRGEIGLFFYPVECRLMTDPETSRQPSGRGTFLPKSDDRFLELLTFSHCLKNPAKTTWFALVFWVSRTVRTVLNDFFWTTFVAAFFLNYHDKNFSRKYQAIT